MGTAPCTLSQVKKKKLETHRRQSYTHTHTNRRWLQRLQSLSCPPCGVWPTPVVLRPAVGPAAYSLFCVFFSTCSCAAYVTQLSCGSLEQASSVVLQGEILFYGKFQPLTYEPLHWQHVVFLTTGEATLLIGQQREAVDKPNNIVKTVFLSLYVSQEVTDN